MKGSLWFPAHPATQRLLGTELRNAGLPPVLREYLWEEEQTHVNASTIPSSFVITYLINDYLLSSPLKHKLHEGRIFASVLFTLALAQGLLDKITNPLAWCM